jgi:valyl-tRNA synthetase
MSGLQFTNKVPFSDVMFHVMIRDEKGRKMSKSLGNSPEPMELIDKYGADALRFGLLLITPREQDVLFTEKSIDVGRKFCNKLWNAARLVCMNSEKGVESQEMSIYDRWILDRFNHLLDSIERHFALFEINAITREMYDFIWHIFCDWYLEFTKVVRAGPTARTLMKNLIVILHPFMPFITEEIYHRFKFPQESIMLEKWPGKVSVKQDISRVDHVVRLIEEIRNIRGIFNIKMKEKLRIVINTDKRVQSFLDENADVIRKLGHLDHIEYNQPVPKSAASIIMPEMECYLELTGIDVQKEKQRLLKEVGFLSQRIDEIKYRLNNPSYVNKATTDMQEREKKRLEDFLKKKEGIEKAVEKL